MDYAGVDGPSVVFFERRGSRGAGYFHFVRDGELMPVCQEGEERDIRRSGTTKKVNVRVPKTMFESPETVYYLRISHGGNISVEKYSMWVVEDALRSEKRVGENIADLQFAVVGNEEVWIQRFLDRVPGLVRRVQEIQRDFEFEFEFSSSAVRTQELFRDPSVALKSSLIFSTGESRVQSLKQKMGDTFELFAFCEILACLSDPEEFDHSQLLLADTAESPLTMFETSMGWVTVWRYYPLAARDDSHTSYQLQPDFVLFNGLFAGRESAWKKGMNESVVVEIKTAISGEVVDQLVKYAEEVPSGTRLLLGCYDPPEDPPDELVSSGWVITELSRGDCSGFHRQIKAALDI